jgi:hypothetical protein
LPSRTRTNQRLAQLESPFFVELPGVWRETAKTPHYALEPAEQDSNRTVPRVPMHIRGLSRPCHESWRRNNESGGFGEALRCSPFQSAAWGRSTAQKHSIVRVLAEKTLRAVILIHNPGIIRDDLFTEKYDSATPPRKEFLEKYGTMTDNRWPYGWHRIATSVGALCLRNSV